MDTLVTKALVKAKGITLASQAKKRYTQTPFEDKETEEMYLAIWRFLSDEEAPVQAKACKLASEAKKLFEKAFQNSFAKTAFRNRWIELANDSAALMASSCSTSAHAEQLAEDAPEDSRAKEIFLNKLLELRLEEQAVKRRGAKTLVLVRNSTLGVIHPEERRRSTDRRAS